MSSHFGSIFLLNFILFCIINICSPNDGNAQSSGVIKGKVTDEKTSNPLPLANIIVEGTSWGTATDEQGDFEIKNLVPGTYTIVVTLVGYERQLYTNLAVRAGEVITQAVSLVEKSVQLGDVTIYGASLRNERITDAPASVSVLTAKEIRLNSISGQVPKLLETEPGVDIVQSGINDYNVNTRGFNSSLNRRLLVLLDGRDQAVALLGSQEWNGFSIPCEDIGRLELIRGPGSSLYGANAFNGVINILTPPPKDIVGAKVSLAGGEKNSARTDVRYAAVSEQWSYKFNVGRVQGDTWSVSRRSFPFEYQGLNPFLNSEVVELSRNKVASTYGSGRVDYEFKDGVTSTLEGGITRVENAVLVTGIGRIQVPKAVKPWGRINYNSGNLYIQTWAAARNSIKPQVSLSTGLPLEEKSFVSQLEMQYRFSALQDNLFVILGGAHKYQFVDTEGTVILGSHHDNTSGLFTQLEYELLDGVKSVVAARWDRSTLHSSQFSPKIALIWTPIVGHSFRATFNKAFQAPNYTELFLNVKHPIRNLAYFGNADLIVEKITGYELGYKGVVGDAVYVTVDGYYNQLKDFVTDLVPNVNPKYPGQIMLPGENFLRTIWSYGNAGKVNEFGFEVSVNYYINKIVQLNANYSYFDFEVKSKGKNDVLLPNAPAHKVNGGITFSTHQYQVSMSVKYVPTFEWAAGIFRGDILAYTLVNLEATYKINTLIELGLNVTNLLDREHYQIFGGSLIGRRAIFSMTATI